MLRKMVGENEKTYQAKVDLAHLPPCKNNPIPHVGLVNYRLAIYKRANQQRFGQPKPCDDGQQWVKIEDGFLETVWSCEPILPPSIADDLIEKAVEEEEEDEIDLWLSRVLDLSCSKR